MPESVPAAICAAAATSIVHISTQAQRRLQHDMCTIPIRDGVVPKQQHSVITTCQLKAWQVHTSSTDSSCHSTPARATMPKARNLNTMQGMYTKPNRHTSKACRWPAGTCMHSTCCESPTTDAKVSLGSYPASFLLYAHVPNIKHSAMHHTGVTNLCMHQHTALNGNQKRKRECQTHGSWKPCRWGFTSLVP
jgi:hypothetical protein